jgi:predicted HicB family RNase H-like nuclease
MHRSQVDSMKTEACTESIMLRLPPKLRDRIETAASQEGRSLSQMARRIIQNWAEREGEQGRAA